MPIKADNWINYSQYSRNSQPLDTNYLSGKDVLKFRDEAWHTYHTNPNYLQLIKNKFGEATVTYIKNLVEIKLIRN